MVRYEPTNNWECLFRDLERPNWAISKHDTLGEVSLTHRCLKRTIYFNVTRIEKEVIRNKPC